MVGVVGIAETSRNGGGRSCSGETVAGEALQQLYHGLGVGSGASTRIGPSGPTVSTRLV